MDLHRSIDGEARSAVVRTVSGLVKRPIVKLAKLDVKKVNITQKDAQHLRGGDVAMKLGSTHRGHVTIDTPCQLTDVSTHFQLPFFFHISFAIGRDRTESKHYCKN